MVQQLLQGLVAQQAGGPGILGSMVPFLLIFAVMYFLIIRPQQKQAKEQQNFLSRLQKGDDVMLQGGFFGKVAQVGTTDVHVELAPGVKVRVLKSAVAGPAKAADAGDVKPEAEKKN